MQKLSEILIFGKNKTSKDLSKDQMRQAYGRFAGLTGIFCNVLLSVVKFLVGMAASSMSVMADAVNNLSDAASSVISMVGMKVADRPADQDHPFGHGRVEYISALIVSMTVIQVGLTFLKGAIEKIRNPEPMSFGWVTIALLALSVAVKLGLFVFDRKIAKKIDSESYRAASLDSLFDSVATGVTIASLFVYQFLEVNIDGIAELFVSLFIIWGGVSLTRDTFSPLIGQKMDPDLYHKIEEIVRSQDHIVDTHDLIIHNYGPEHSMATIHAEVSRNLSVVQAHEAADAAEKAVAEELGISLVVHVDPVETSDKRVLSLRNRLTRVCAIIDSNLRFHDFRVEFAGNKNGKNEKSAVFFDLVIPYGYSQAEEEKVLFQIMSLMQEFNPGYQYIIKVDRGVMEEKTFSSETEK